MNLMRPGELFVIVLFCTHPKMTGTLTETLDYFQGVKTRFAHEISKHCSQDW